MSQSLPLQVHFMQRTLLWGAVETMSGGCLVLPVSNLSFQIFLSHWKDLTQGWVPQDDVRACRDCNKIWVLGYLIKLSTSIQHLSVNHYQLPSDGGGLHLDQVVSLFILAKTEQSRKRKILQVEGKEKLRCLAASGNREISLLDCYYLTTGKEHYSSVQQNILY